MGTFWSVSLKLSILHLVSIISAVVYPEPSPEMNITSADISYILVFLGSLLFLIALILLAPLEERFRQTKVISKLIFWIPTVFSMGLVITGLFLIVVKSL
jgi:hypothetical protein